MKWLFLRKSIAVTKAEFDKDFIIHSYISLPRSYLFFFCVEVERKSDGRIFRAAKCEFYQSELDDKVALSQYSDTPLNKDEIIDMHIRFCLDVVSQYFKISDWHPMNIETDISYYVN